MGVKNEGSKKAQAYQRLFRDILRRIWGIGLFLPYKLVHYGGFSRTSQVSESLSLLRYSGDGFSYILYRGIVREYLLYLQ